MESNIKFAHFITQSYKGFVITKNKKEGDNNSFSELAINNNHSLSNQHMQLLAIPIKI